MSLLSIAVNACDNIGVTAPTSIIGNTDPAAKRLLQLARRTTQSLRTRANWVSLVLEHVFIADGSTTFALPADYDRLVSDTLWDRTRFWQMRGAMSPQQWQMWKSSRFGRATIQRRWRIRAPSGSAAGGTPGFEIDPPLSTTDTTSTLVFEYVTKNTCRSQAVYSLEQTMLAAGGSAYTLGDLITIVSPDAQAIDIGGGEGAILVDEGDAILVSEGTIPPNSATLIVTQVDGSGAILAAQVLYAGIYTTPPASPASVSGGTGTGATFLTSTTVIFPGQTKPDWTADTDTSLLSEELLELGVIWRLQQRLGLAYLEEKNEYERQVDQAVARDGGTATLDLAPSGDGFFLGTLIPEGNFSSGVGGDAVTAGGDVLTP